jgi:sodium/bile acid cotransporter 3/5
MHVLLPGVVKETIRRPVGPAIGFVCQFLLMPIIAFCLGLLFTDQPAIRLGLFVTGVSPGGGGSNIWTLMFGGNLNLSLTMTALSTLAAFAMMPAWIFTLGRVILDDADIVIPYAKLLMYVTCLIVPLGIGLLITRFLPKVSKFLVKVLKPLALFLIMFILIFGVWANLYMFKLMTWKVLATGMALPWLGFAFGCTVARLAGRPVEDVTAIAIETGLQNTGVSIFVLWFTFGHPIGDLAGRSI